MKNLTAQLNKAREITMKKLKIVLVSFLVLVIAGFAQAATIHSQAVRAKTIAEDNSSNTLAEDEGDGSFIMDDTAPFVVTSNPLPGAMNVPLEVDFSVTFSEPMNEASVFNSLFKLENLNTGSTLENVSLQNLVDWGTVSASFNASGDVLSMTSTTYLEPNTTYRITVIEPITATDLDGNVLYTDETQFLFTTIGDPLAATSVTQATGPLDLEVTDPMGRTITKSISAIPSASYIELDFDDDGNLDDRVVIPRAMMGIYTIKVIPTWSTGTYTLVVSYGDELITLADNLPIQTRTYSFFFPQRMMEQGWNLISVPVQLPNYTIVAAFQSIISNCSTVWSYETTDTGGEWKRYVRNAPAFLSNFWAIQSGRGYWVRMADTAVLTLDGDQVAAYPPDLLKPGWVLAGYNDLEAKRIENIPLPLNCNAVWTYNIVDGGWKRYIVGGSDNDLEWMKPGEGYWMNIGGAAPPAPVWLHVASTDRPGIPYTIWGSVEIDGERVTGKGRNGAAAPTVLLKVDDKVRSNYQLGTVARYGDFYVLDVPETDKSPQPPFQRGESFGSAQVELYVQVEDTLIKAGPVPPGKAGEIMRLDLSARIPPKVSVLYQNYPNPFNPDTWIPYQLKEDAHVVIRIYTATGQLVRTLNLGHKPAGFYTNKDSAAYWDGRNEEGEDVSSGIYFYIIQAGDLAATRKMAIVK